MEKHCNNLVKGITSLRVHTVVFFAGRLNYEYNTPCFVYIIDSVCHSYWLLWWWCQYSWPARFRLLGETKRRVPNPDSQTRAIIRHYMTFNRKQEVMSSEFQTGCTTERRTWYHRSLFSPNPKNIKSDQFKFVLVSIKTHKSWN